MIKILWLATFSIFISGCLHLDFPPISAIPNSLDNNKPCHGLPYPMTDIGQNLSKLEHYDEVSTLSDEIYQVACKKIENFGGNQFYAANSITVFNCYVLEINDDNYQHTIKQMRKVLEEIKQMPDEKPQDYDLLKRNPLKLK